MVDDGDMDDSCEQLIFSSDNYLKPTLSLHSAAEKGDIKLIVQVIDVVTSGIKNNLEGQGLLQEQVKMLVEAKQKQLLNSRDMYNRMPIHSAILKGQIEVVDLLLDLGSPLDSPLLGCVHLALCIGSIHEQKENSINTLKVLLKHKAQLNYRDYLQRHALHWACVYNLKEQTEFLLKEILQTQEDGQDFFSLDLQDFNNDSPLHLAARYNSIDAFEAFVSIVNNYISTISQEEVQSTRQYDVFIQTLTAQNRQNMTPLHYACMHNHVSMALRILKYSRNSLSVKNRWGQIPATMALNRGHKELALLLSNKDLEKIDSRTLVDQKFSDLPTLILAPEECQLHLTSMRPGNLERGSMPSENILRLDILTKPGFGIFHSSQFSTQTIFQKNVKPVSMGDLLRVHDWRYVSSIQKLCGECREATDEGSTLKLLDSDTIISKDSYQAALYAVGAVIEAVDAVMEQKVKNAFCAVRPPGHHAGPMGKVHNEMKMENDTNGFCLFNNIAVGAAYALNQYRHKGIKKVAILDFDVHHGNGTQECLVRTQPTELKFEVENLFGISQYRYPFYKPWLDLDDKENIFFASTQAYGLENPLVPKSYFYPGSGYTEDNQMKGKQNIEKLYYINQEYNLMVSVENNVNVNVGVGVKRHRQGQDGNDSQIKEDPDSEFQNKRQTSSLIDNAPRIINVGIPGPGAKVSLWRRAWRDKILPALVNFNPDMIFISAGFDAHKKDLINHHFVGIQEREYEWLTDQIVQVANRCCDGRIVSALEGGYTIEGGPISPLARSVSAHVQALVDNNKQIWDPQESHIERSVEKFRRIQREKQLALLRQQKIVEDSSLIEKQAMDDLDIKNIIEGPRSRRTGTTKIQKIDAEMQVGRE